MEPAIKQENGVVIKSEPGMGSPMAEDDLLEDAGDVEFYDKSIPNDPFGNMYLVRIPNSLWKAWSQLDDDAEIELGAIRQISLPPKRPGERNQSKLELRLRPDLAQHQNVPKEYDLNVTNQLSSNHFIFSERDLPNYVSKNKEKERAIAAGIPTHLLRKRQQAQQGQQEDNAGEPPAKKSRRERYAEQERRSIPKKTKIEGAIKHEVTCTPKQNAETQHFMVMNSLKAHEQKRGPTFINDMAPGALMDDSQFAGFIKHRTDAPKAVKKNDNKNARWASNILLDRLFECFAEKQYWPMKAIKQRVPQPEAYLREKLMEIAELRKHGRFANTWELTPQFKSVLAAEKGMDAATNSEVADVKEELDDDDDEDLNMEDALL